MLNSLEIKNYRNLKEFRINSLGRVNLITGKNNTGKSTILEAIAIFASKGDLDFIFHLLSERGENYRTSETKNPIDINVRSLSSLFTNRLVSLESSDAISIGNIERSSNEVESAEKPIVIRFVKYAYLKQKDNQGHTVIRRRILHETEDDSEYDDVKIGFEIKSNGDSFLIPLDDDRPFRNFRFGAKGISDYGSFQFVRTRNIDREINGNLFDDIALTEKEQYVIDALKIIEPSTERIAFVEESSSRERSAVVKLSNSQVVLPLRSMGDGMNRILTIILALVNSDNRLFIIDEFENGLHYTVQEKLWKIIFNLSEKLNIQVFATTHSEDCILGFEKVLNSSGNSQNGKLIRLDSENGTIKAVEFNANELKIASEHNIETR